VESFIELLRHILGLLDRENDPFEVFGTRSDNHIASVPEPSTWAMMLVGFAGLGFAGYRASRRTAALATS
jgi:hypothetical protein